MPDIDDLMGRFGDLEFLHELWNKAKLRLPREIAETDAVLESAKECPDEALYTQVHRIRGAIANFFNKTPTLDQLILCETLSKQGTLPQLRSEWSLFKSCFETDKKALEEWLCQEGFSNQENETS